MKKALKITFTVLTFIILLSSCTAPVQKTLSKTKVTDINWVLLENKRITEVISRNDDIINLEMCEAYYYPDRNTVACTYFEKMDDGVEVEKNIEISIDDIRYVEFVDYEYDPEKTADLVQCCIDILCGALEAMASAPH